MMMMMMMLSMMEREECNEDREENMAEDIRILSVRERERAYRK